MTAADISDPLGRVVVLQDGPGGAPTFLSRKLVRQAVAGADRLGPERMRFDTVIDGRARRAWRSGWPSYRVDTWT